MAQLVDFVGELIHEVGPRPAGTQQEHQAAELIAARLDGFGMHVDIEEFSCSRNLGWVRVLYYALGVIGTAVTIFLPNFSVWGIVLAAVGAVLMLLDYVGKNPLFTVFKNSLSQNVIARHLPPGADPQSRSRKVVILANYDSARRMVQAAPPLVGRYVLLRRIVRVAMVVLVVLMLLTLIPFLSFMRGVLAVPIDLAGAVVLLALLTEVANLFMPWSQGVNCNASSIGVLYGLARMLTSDGDEATADVAVRSGRRRAATGGSGGRGGARSGRAARADRTDRADRASRSAQSGRSGRIGTSDEAGMRAATGTIPTRATRQSGAGAVTAAAVGAGAAAGAAAAGAAGAAGAGAAGVVGAAGAAVGAGAAGAAGGMTEPMDSRVSPRGALRNAEQAGHSVQPPLDDISVQAVAESFTQPVRSGQPVRRAQPVSPPVAQTQSQTQSPASGLSGTGAQPVSEPQSQPRSQEQANHNDGGAKTAQRVPAWFANAKKNAEKHAERNQQQSADDPEIVRSRFADVPTSGRIERTDDEPRGLSEEQAETRSGAQHGAASGTPGQPEALLEGQAQGEAQGQAQGQAARQASSHARSAAELSRQDASHTAATSAEQATTQAATQAAMQAASQAGQRTITPITVQPDFSGLDRQAFKVLPNDENRDGSAIVPEAQPVARIDAPVLVTPVATPRVREVPAVLASVQTSEQRGGLPAADSLGLPAPTPSPALDAAPASGFAPDAAPASGSEELSAAQLKLRNRLRGLPTVAAENTGNFPAYQANLDTQLVAKEDLFSSDNSVVSATGAFVPLGTTGVMKPISDELLAYHNEGEIYIADADDTTITEHYSQTGEYSEPELVDIPDSRVKSFLGSMGERLTGKKRERLDNPPSSWLGVDARFDARKEGNDIGSWDNFNEENENWNGGAYGGGSFEANVGAMVNLSNELLDKEVWLVALGASESKNEGLNNLIANHESELKNALFINLLGVGMGDLVFTISEGNYRPVLTDHRMQSLIASAAENMAIPMGPVRFPVFTTDGTVALRKGSRAISIMGLGNQTPLGWRWSDDDTSRLKEDNLLDVVAVIGETIKNS